MVYVKKGGKTGYLKDILVQEPCSVRLPQTEPAGQRLKLLVQS